MSENIELEKSPYYEVLEKIKHKKRKDLNDLLRFRFSKFAWLHWTHKQSFGYGKNIDPDKFQKNFDSFNEDEIFKKIDLSSFDETYAGARIAFEKHLEKWTTGASLFLKCKLQFVRQINHYTQKILNSFSSVKASNVVYLEQTIGKQLEPLFTQFDKDKSDILLLTKAGEAVFRLICDHIGTPPDAFLFLNVNTGSDYIYSSFTPNCIRAYKARFPKKEILRIKKVLPGCGFYQESDFHIFEILRRLAILPEGNPLEEIGQTNSPENSFNLSNFDSLQDYIF